TTVVISDIPVASDEGECQRATDDTFVRSFTFTPVEWGIILNESGPGVHTVSMEADIRPLTADLVEGVSGTLIWDETVVDLCAIGTEQEGVGLLHIGDTFQTTEGCGDNPTAMQDAFDDFGLPKRACVMVTVDGLDHEYCAPLQVPEDVSVGSEPGTVTVLFDGLEVFGGLAVDAWVLPLEPTREKQALGGTRLGVINGDRYLGFAVMHPQREGYFDVVADEVAFFSPGTYRFIIEAYVPLGDMFYGCEQQIQVVEDEPTIVSLSSLPTYTSSGWHWAPYEQLEYPDCP
ncbi:MAG: hypothetical protein HKN95_07940, partial [Acidimicrobiia bacterium]|nr:hypothetical protein [Acidimicrobiia bacterium]